MSNAVVTSRPEAQPAARPEASSIGSVAQLLHSRLVRDAEKTAALHKTGGKWAKLTWAELCAEVERVAWGVLALGAAPGARLAILGNTRLEWTLCDLGVAQAGGVVVPIYQSSTPAEIRFILEDCGAMALFVEGPAELEKLRAVRDRLPKLERIVVMDGDGEGEPGVITLDELRALGDGYRRGAPRELEHRLAAGRPDDLAMIIYTSGTTGIPKGVMLHNDSVLHAAEVTVGAGMFGAGDLVMTFLPFAHVAAQLGKYACLATGATAVYAERLDKLVDNAGETGPTVLGSVPRIFEKAFNNVVAAGLAEPGLKGKLFRMALDELDRYAEARDQGRTYSSLRFTLAKKLVFARVQQRFSQRFGGRLRVLVSGGSALPRKIGYFFELIGYEILELYGLTETNAITTCNRPGRNRIGTVGEPWPGVELRIAADGEILQKSRSVMKGYYNRPEITAEALDAEGWFHTGDIGMIDDQGYLRITDRKKDLIKTSGGKYVAPQALEGALKTASELVSQVVVVGDQRRFVSVLVTLSEEPARKLALSAGDLAGSLAEISRSPAVHAAVQAAVDRVNADLPSFSTIKKVTILDRDFSLETGELTPSLKVKRKTCYEKYRAQIEAMYDEGLRA